jgi:hypothetical protein
MLVRVARLQTHVAAAGERMEPTWHWKPCSFTAFEPL